MVAAAQVSRNSVHGHGEILNSRHWKQEHSLTNPVKFFHGQTVDFLEHGPIWCFITGKFKTSRFPNIQQPKIDSKPNAK